MKNDKRAVYPRAHKVRDVVKVVVEVGDGKAFVNKIMLNVHQYLVDVVRTIEIKSTDKLVLPRRQKFIETNCV